MIQMTVFLFPLKPKAEFHFVSPLCKAEGPSDMARVTEDLGHRGEHGPARVLWEATHTQATTGQSFITPSSERCTKEGIHIFNVF